MLSGGSVKGVGCITGVGAPPMFRSPPVEEDLVGGTELSLLLLRKDDVLVFISFASTLCIFYQRQIELEMAS